MREIISKVPNKLKALYILWVFINVIFFVYGYGNRPSLHVRGDQRRWDLAHFFPFDTGDLWYNTLKSRALGTYDYTEFLIYVLTPVILSYVIWLFMKKSKPN